jgi:hypothetical protein
MPVEAHTPAIVPRTSATSAGQTADMLIASSALITVAAR